MRRATLVPLTLALTFASGGAHAVSPVQPENRPRPLPGVANGEVPASMLIQVTPTCVAVRGAASSLHRLFAQARAAGISLDADECYRPLAGQIRARRRATANGNPACAASLATNASGHIVGTSMHGWGKAADFTDAGRTLTFSSHGYRFLVGAAAAVGWNHPGWARPGGSRCPEPWHWEWVGDGGRQNLEPIRADAVALVPAVNDTGYLTVTGLGAVHARGAAVDRGSMIAVPLAWVVVGAQPTPTRVGYWLVAGDGGVFSFGDADFHGSTAGMRLNASVLGMASTRTGDGYWLYGWDGGVFSFGDARFYGSTGGMTLLRPVVDMAATPSGRGYWLAAADGGVFSFGDARFLGSMGGVPLAQPVVGMARTPSGRGYWLVAGDGGVFTFGDAVFRGSGATLPAGSPFVDIVATRTGKGYWLLRADGTVVAFGDAVWHGNG